MADTPVDLHPPPETRSEPERLFQPNRSMLGFDSIILSGPSVPDDYTTSFDLGFDTGEAPYDRDCFFCEGGYDDDYVDESVNFGTDLFESRQPLVDAGDSNWEFDSDGDEDDLGFEYGFGPGSGLRVVDMDSDADSEEFEVNSGIHGGNNIDTAYDDDDDDSDGAYIDDVFGINVETIDEDDAEDFEWEEVSERFNLDERDELNSVIDRIQGISVTSEVTSSSEDEIDSELDEDDHVRNTEWEVLLAMNNIDRGFNFENPDDVGETVSIVSSAHRIPEDYVLAMEYDALFGQLVENANSNKGSPPASKRAVESLQTIVLKKTDIVEENGCGGVITCAVCKDEVAVGEKVTKMPCAHLYHGECILPWLKIRNTCPVCRFELPTDDASYEQRRASRVVRDGGDRSGAVLRAGNNNLESLP